ncbi:MAG: 4-hydroxybutyrate CoA-transferase, partial [Chloroflexota bacterium]
MNWESIYRRKVTDADTALASVQSGQRVYVGGGAGAPATLVDALTRRAPKLRDVEVVHVLTFVEAPYLDPRYEGSFRHNALFIGDNARQAVQEGRADFTPVFLSEIPGLFREGGTLPLDVALITLSPPDEHGFCSFGVEVGTTKPAAEAARIIVAQVNRQMPRTLGDSFIHVSRLQFIVEVNYPLPEVLMGGSSDLHLQVGQHIAGMIENGSTLQLGIGSIPDAVLKSLTNHKDLGIHTELF